MVATWVLILTVFHASEGVAVTSVAGFSSEATCQTAGQLYVAKNNSGMGHAANAVCVQQ